MTSRSTLSMMSGVMIMILFVPCLMAQTGSTGSISGTVTDPSGAVIPGVEVIATNNETGQVRTVATGGDGSYRFTLLPPGHYRIRFTMSGFKPMEVPSFRLSVTESPVLNRRLELGSPTEQVTVEANVETVQTTSSTLGTVIGSQHLTDLPLTTRNYTALVGLSAGAMAGVGNAAAFGRGGTDVAVNGAPSGSNNYNMDGVSVTNYANSTMGAGGGTTSTYTGFGVPNPDALQEFKIQTSQYDAGYGRAAGANVNVVTKSGTNTFHGTAFEFFRNTTLNANEFFRNKTCAETPSVCLTGSKLIFNQNQFGGVLGGPIKKDKLFFFASYQRTWQKNGSAGGFSSGNLPVMPIGDRGKCSGYTLSTCDAIAQQFIKGLGTYSASATNAGGTRVASDGSNINPIAIKYLQAQNADGSYVMPSSPTGQSVAVNWSVPAYMREHQGMMNIDYLISSKNTLAVRFYRSQETQLQSFVGGGSAVPGTPADSDLGFYNGVIKLTTIFGNNLVNEARVSVTRSVSWVLQRPPASWDVSNIYPNIAPGMNVIGYGEPWAPVVNISGVYSAGGKPGGDATTNNTQPSFGDQLSWTKGKHFMRLGFEIEKAQWNQEYRGMSRGVMAFQTFQDFLVGLPGNCGAAVPGVCNGGTASNILNTSGWSDRAGPSGTVHGYRNSYASWFVQDDWKVAPRLTVNAGLRWEYLGNVSDKYGNATNLWISAIQTAPVPAVTQVPTPGIDFKPVGGSYAGWVVPSNFSPSTWGTPPNGVIISNHKIESKNEAPLDNFGPRLGIAWQPTGSNRLAVRAGGAFLYSRIPGGTLQGVALHSPPYTITQDKTGVANSFASEAKPFGDTPLGSFPMRWVNFGGTTAYNQSSNIAATGMAEHFGVPLVYSWNLNVQYEFIRRWVLDIGYVGTHGIHQTFRAAVNAASIATATNPVNGVTTSTVANAALRVPYLGMAPTWPLQQTDGGSTKFNSLQATLRKQLSHGLAFQAAYTFSRAFEGYHGINDALANGYSTMAEYRPHRVVINYNWDIWSGNLKGVPGKLIKGWSLSGVTTIQSGQPLGVTDNRGGTAYGLAGGSGAQMATGATYADVATPGGIKERLGGGSGGPGYFNKAAFTTIPLVAGTNGTGWGNSGSFILLGPGQFNFDASLARTIRVGGLNEAGKLQIRAEAFNVLNHTQFGNPSTNFAVSTFGRITTTSVNPRLIQLALKYIF